MKEFTPKERTRRGHDQEVKIDISNMSKLESKTTIIRIELGLRKALKKPKRP